MEQNYYDIFAGTYTVKTGSTGIYRIRLDSAGMVENVGVAGYANNPSYLCLNNGCSTMYALSECEKGAAVTTYHIQGQQCKVVSQVGFASDGLCHIYYSEKNDFVLASCYLSGDYYNLRASDCSVLSHIIHTPQKRAVPHAHCAITDHSGSFVLCADLGLDTISSYAITGGELADTPACVYSCEKSSGPRQLVFHPRMNMLYAVNELNSTVSLFLFNPSSGKLKLLQTISASDSAYLGENYPAGITTTSDGSFLYVSNRGADTIAVFRLLPSGLLIRAGEFSCGGRYPRHVLLTSDEKFLIISNQRSNNIVVCPVHSIDGSIGLPVEAVDIPAPSCTIEYIIR